MQKYQDLLAKLNGKRRDKKIRIRVRASSISGALEALDRAVTECSLSDDEHTRVIDSSYWSRDFYDFLKAAERRTKWWKKK